ncbi:hypothetical protein NH340_JMT08989 [Sarcoptes scabiei]|nr:hypothetical protein NH340_JMT08989 [Sarcoptes scabiei]
MEKEMLIALREIADSFPFTVTIYHHYFIFFDQFVLVRSISIQTITVAAIVMMAISLVFIPSPSCAIWVAFSIISIEIGVIGYMTLWNVNLDSISMINLIMCIGFSVDFSAHISYAYISCHERTPSDRVRSALYSLGLPIFQGSVSTVLGIIALAFAPSYVFVTFFKTVFLVMLFGATHAERFFDGKTIVHQNGGPIYIPRPSYINLKGPKEKKNLSDSNESNRSMEARNHSTKFLNAIKSIDGVSVEGSDGSVVLAERDLGLGTSVEECSESSWKACVENNEIFVIDRQPKSEKKMNFDEKPASKRNPYNKMRKFSPKSSRNKNGSIMMAATHINDGYISDSGPDLTPKREERARSKLFVSRSKSNDEIKDDYQRSSSLSATRLRNFRKPKERVMDADDRDNDDVVDVDQDYGRNLNHNQKLNHQSSLIDEEKHPQQLMVMIPQDDFHRRRINSYALPILRQSNQLVDYHNHLHHRNSTSSLKETDNNLDEINREQKQPNDIQSSSYKYFDHNLYWDDDDADRWSRK